MIFTSFRFIIFAAAAAAGYFVMPLRMRWSWLLFCSAVFYLCAGTVFLPYLLFSAGVTFLSARFVSRAVKPGARKALLALGLGLNLGVLAFLKYYNFIGGSIARIAGGNFTAVDLLLPLGISFYTFTSSGYLIDVFRGVCPAERNPLKLLLFLSYFPHVMQGPIDRYDALAPQLFEGHKFDFDAFVSGVTRMAWGFFKKLVVADRLGIAVNAVFADSGAYSGGALALAVFFYAAQILCDFSGYMDIACGFSEILGIRLAENFRAPYFAVSVPDFWRRWHITLGSWFRDYLFYPILRSSWCRKLSRFLKRHLGRKPSADAVNAIALSAVWLLTGLWHGASWHYIAWGGYYGLLIILSSVCSPWTAAAAQKLGLRRGGRLLSAAGTLRTFALVLVGYVFFRAGSMTQALSVLGRIFTLAGGKTALALDAADLTVGLVSLSLVAADEYVVFRGRGLGERLSAAPGPVRGGVLMLLIFASLIFGIWGPGYSASSFIYFNF